MLVLFKVNLVHSLKALPKHAEFHCKAFKSEEIATKLDESQTNSVCWGSFLSDKVLTFRQPPVAWWRPYQEGIQTFWGRKKCKKMLGRNLKIQDKIQIFQEIKRIQKSFFFFLCKSWRFATSGYPVALLVSDILPFGFVWRTENRNCVSLLLVIGFVFVSVFVP